jgi:hypothetical protein
MSVVIVRLDDQCSMSACPQCSCHVGGEWMHVGTRSHRDGERCGIDRSGHFIFAHHDDPRPITTLTTDSFHRLQRQWSTNAVDLEAVVLLEFAQAICGEWPKDSICFATVESESRETNLKLFDVVTSEVWRREIQQS